AELLRGPSPRDLDSIAADPELRHRPLERLAVLGDLARQVAQRLAERGAAVRARCPPRQLRPAGRAGEVVVEVDREQFAIHAEYPRARPIAAMPATAGPTSGAGPAS